LCVGDEVIMIDGESLAGVGQTSLNAIMISALHNGTWKIGVCASTTAAQPVTIVTWTAA
jgi:hypothetical protein